MSKMKDLESNYNCINNLENIITYKTSFYSNFLDKEVREETVAIIPYTVVPMMYSKNIHNKELDEIHEMTINNIRYIVYDIYEIEDKYILRMQEVDSDSPFLDIDSLINEYNNKELPKIIERYNKGENEPNLQGPKYLECSDIFGNTWYKNLHTGEDLPIGAVPLDLD